MFQISQDSTLGVVDGVLDLSKKPRLSEKEISLRHPGVDVADVNRQPHSDSSAPEDSGIDQDLEDDSFYSDRGCDVIPSQGPMSHGNKQHVGDSARSPLGEGQSEGSEKVKAGVQIQDGLVPHRDAEDSTAKQNPLTAGAPRASEGQDQSNQKNRFNSTLATNDNLVFSRQENTQILQLKAKIRALEYLVEHGPHGGTNNGQGSTQYKKVGEQLLAQHKTCLAQVVKNIAQRQSATVPKQALDTSRNSLSTEVVTVASSTTLPSVGHCISKTTTTPSVKMASMTPSPVVVPANLPSNTISSTMDYGGTRTTQMSGPSIDSVWGIRSMNVGNQSHKQSIGIPPNSFDADFHMRLMPNLNSSNTAANHMYGATVKKEDLRNETSNLYQSTSEKVGTLTSAAQAVKTESNACGGQSAQSFHMSTLEKLRNLASHNRNEAVDLSKSFSNKLQENGQLKNLVQEKRSTPEPLDMRAHVSVPQPSNLPTPSDANFQIPKTPAKKLPVSATVQYGNHSQALDVQQGPIKSLLESPEQLVERLKTNQAEEIPQCSCKNG